ncbi:MAG TPA: DUF6600 domain-containing protein [Polyangiaceae bacterium]|nr:DUF6600 domain-containing protein [Polyangiaceae bacterium]
MSPSRIGSFCVALLAAASVTRCELGDEPQPVAPQNAMIPPPPDVSPPVAPAASGVPEGAGETMYSSGEVALGAEREGYDDDDPAALTDFHATLDPRGTWADDPVYGTVWVPSPAVVGPDFQPYVSAGHWAYDDDWVWVSDYDWGWAPFHYGRWVSIEGRGWSWIPGRVYRGAWVTWGVDDGYGYLGWAPMAPAFIWFGGFARPFPGYVGPRWVYCPRGEVFSASVRTRVVSGAAAAPIAARVRPYVPAAPGVAAAGPSPQKMGFQSAQIPHSAGAPSVARAQQFSHPSTALALGAHAPTRVSPIAPGGQSPGGVGGRALPTTQGAGRAATAAPTPGRAPATGGHGVAPAPLRGGSGRGSTVRGGGGGHHR